MRSVAVAVRGGDELAAVDGRTEIQIFRVNAEPAFRQQQIAKHKTRALEAIGDIEYFGDELEAIADVQRSGHHSRIVSKSGAEHLPEVALLGLGGDAGGGTG